MPKCNSVNSWGIVLVVGRKLLIKGNNLKIKSGFYSRIMIYVE